MTYTTAEAAALLGVAPKTVTQYIGRGLLHATKRGRDLFIADADLQHFIATRRTPGRPKKH